MWNPFSNHRSPIPDPLRGERGGRGGHGYGVGRTCRASPSTFAACVRFRLRSWLSYGGLAGGPVGSARFAHGGNALRRRHKRRTPAKSAMPWFSESFRSNLTALPVGGPMAKGSIVLLNGASSSGKTSIAQELQAMLDEPYLRLGIDSFGSLLPERYLGVEPAIDEPAYEGLKWILPVDEATKAQIKRSISPSSSIWETMQQYRRAIEELDLLDSILQKGVRIETGSVFRQLITGMHQSIASLASSGNNLIFDHVLLERDWLTECVDLLSEFQVLFVGVRCPIQVVEKRERERGNRFPGQARGHFHSVHSHQLYDLEVDTSSGTPRDSAAEIRDRLESGPDGNAFTQLRALGRPTRSSP